MIPNTSYEYNPASIVSSEVRAGTETRTYPVWYPNKKQWEIIWLAFFGAAAALIIGVSEREPATGIAVALCALVGGSLGVWYLNKKD